MENEELVNSVAQVVGQAMGEISVGVAMAVLALTDAVSKQPGIDKQRLFTDMLEGLPEGEGMAHNALHVIRQSLQQVMADPSGTP
ncbi:hypothetical protein ACFFGH_02745 [Lysobacter korlensis]|uniref:Uncharacterized protein n=1 Tax=Lysobacter korlensis TaxID=553636 RepID=A0ABV6RIG6_9GAMM